MIERIIDVNINRLREGLRVVEDILRFHNNEETFEELKKIRHKIKEIENKIGYELSLYRNTEEDKGRGRYETETNTTIESIAKANFKRSEESARVLEEIFKLKDQDISYAFKEIRFMVYKIEKKYFTRIDKTKKLNFKIYLVTDSRLTKTPLESILEEAIKGGVDIVQIREKHLSDKEIIRIGEKLKEVCKKYQIPLLIDDRTDICLALDLDGVHLGQEDMPVKYARKLLGEGKIIGKSTHSIEQAENALKEETDYIAFGPIFQTPTKNYEPVGTKDIEKVKELAERYNKKLVLIGGIDTETIKKIAFNIPIACVRALMQEPYSTAVKLKQILGEK